MCAMAMSEAQLRVIMVEYVKEEDLVQKLKEYVPRAEVDARMTTVAKEKVDAEITTGETKDKVVQIAESAVTRLMQQEVQGINDKINAQSIIKEEVDKTMQSFDEKLTQLLNEVEGLKDSRKPTQDDAKEKDDKSDDEKSEDPKDKEIIKLKNMLKELNEQKGKEDDKDNKGKEKRSITMRREFLYLPKYNGKHEEYDDWKFRIKTFVERRR